IAALALLSVSALAQNLKVGAAKVDVTPSVSDLVRSTDSIRGKLYVKAVYISNGTQSAVIAAMDYGGAHGLDEYIKTSSSRTGAPAENYIVTATHTHSGGTAGIGGDNKPNNETLGQALIKAADEAKANARNARAGFGKTLLDLNVNRDNFNEYQEWEQGPNWTGPSDKELTVVSFLDDEDIPIAIIMNYAMHPVNFFISGVVSADYCGDACEFLEDTFGEKTIALFVQGASGDQNPKLAYNAIFREGQIKGVLPPKRAETGQPNLSAEEISPERYPAYKKAIDRKSEYVHMLGLSMAFSTLQVMLYNMNYDDNSVIKSAYRNLSIPGRERLDNSKRENYDPGFKDAPDVNIGVGLLQVGDINFVTVSGEIYTEIGLRLKNEVPAAKTMVVELAHGPRGGGYIYSNNAGNHLTFQVIGSRYKPGYAENGIVNAALEMMKEVKNK
ncbi:MAG: hypothetical protein IJL91_09230, partial [Bacteroidales bacterium]|nr:hypothetical protein [Bacteroidales bacterium]